MLQARVVPLPPDRKGMGPPHPPLWGGGGGLESLIFDDFQTLLHENHLDLMKFVEFQMETISFHMLSLSSQLQRSSTNQQQQPRHPERQPAAANSSRPGMQQQQPQQQQQQQQ